MSSGIGEIKVCFRKLRVLIACWFVVTSMVIRTDWTSAPFQVRLPPQTLRLTTAGILPRAQDPVYSISKLAIVGLTRSLGLCHSKDRVRFNAICPGPVDGGKALGVPPQPA
jgi:NAD(P)-dependent dehydrogenase (short-subunit alcohol dehydrogenase family)